MRRLLLSAALVCSATPLALGAQQRTEQSDTRFQTDCRLAATTLAAGPREPAYEWAIGRAAMCELTGGPALATVWARPPRDTGRLELLVESSWRLRDARIFKALHGAAQERRRPTEVRLAALRALTAYAAPGVFVPRTDLGRADAAGTLRQRFDLLPIDGAVELPDSTREDVQALLGVLAAEDPDPQVRAAAAQLAAGLERTFGGRE